MDERASLSTVASDSGARKYRGSPSHSVDESAARIFRIGRGLKSTLSEIISSEAFDRFRVTRELDFRYKIFDVAYYERKVDKVFEQSENPVFHFCSQNTKYPHVMFDEDHLMSINKSPRWGICETYINVLEQRGAGSMSPNPYFDADAWVKSMDSDDVSPVVDFLSATSTRNVRYSKYFSPRYCSINNSHLREDDVELFLWWLKKIEEGVAVEGNPLFQNQWYRNTYGYTGRDPLIHFIQSGASYGYFPNPFAKHELRFGADPENPVECKERLLKYIEVLDRVN